MNTSHFRTKWLRTSGNFAYLFGVAFLIASLFTSLIPPTVASAHHANVSGNATCNNNGTYTINWKITNWSDANGPMTLTAINRSIGVGTGTQIYVSGVTGSETVQNQSSTITLRVSGSWTNGNTSTNSGSVTLGGNCNPPPTNTPANTPTNTSVPTNTPETPTNTSVPTNTPETPTNTPVPPTDTPTSTPTNTTTPSITNTPENTSTGTVTQTFTPTITPTDTPTETPTFTPTFTPTNTPTNTLFVDPFSVEVFCTSIRIISHNNFQASFEWTINGGPSGTGVLEPFGFVDIPTGNFSGAVVVLFANDQEMARGVFPTNCSQVENTPTPPTIPSRTPRNPTEVVKTLIPDPNTTPEILIPVTGVALAGGGSASRMLFNFGIGLLGLGLVLNGLSRNRKDMEI